MDNSKKYANFVDVCKARAQHKALDTAYIFLANNGEDETVVSYQALDESVSKMAAQLQHQGCRGDNVLLLLPDMQQFVYAFLACQYAGSVPVPSYPPQKKENQWQRVRLLIDDAQVKTVVASDKIKQKFDEYFAPEIARGEVCCLTPGDLEVGEHLLETPVIDPQNLAFIQYTSGSTGNPKGVMVSHANLLNNSELIKQSFEHTEQSVGVSWLPPYHDMGLIGSILQPVYVGFPVILMSPMDFLQKPINWFKAISKYQATTSGGPNFAYQLCAERITPAQMATLDLSSWDLAYYGAERIRHETMAAFAAKFEAYGFNSNAYYPCYGLAESTLMTTGVVKGEKVATAIYGSNQSPDPEITLVGCGDTKNNAQIQIVCPDMHTKCEPGQVGEIWIKGESVSSGYWRNVEATEATFRARINGEDSGHYMRSGDLGFIQQNQLFVAGRLKELIIVNGCNHYPEDIEHVAVNSHEAVTSKAAAFSFETDKQEKVVIVLELKRQFIKKCDHDSVFQAIQSALFETYQLPVHAIVLVKPAAIAVTSSGKVKRSAVSESYLDETLNEVAKWTSPIGDKASLAHQSDGQSTGLAAAQAKTEGQELVPPDVTVSEDIADWLVDKLATVVGLDVGDIHPDELFASFSLDSSVAIEMTGELKQWLQLELDPTIFWEHPSINQLSAYVFEQMQDLNVQV